MTHIKSRITREKENSRTDDSPLLQKEGKKPGVVPRLSGFTQKYAHARLEHCPFGEKSTCRLCTVHCYKPEMRQRMQSVMRYAGPRMLLFYHPIAAIRHLMEETGHLFFTHTN